MRLMTCLVLGILATAFARPAVAGTEPLVDPAAKTRQLLATPVDIPFDPRMTVDQIVPLLEKQVPGLKVILDPATGIWQWRGSAAAGTGFTYWQKLPATIFSPLRQIPAGEALSALLPEDLKWHAEPGGVLILPAKEAGGGLTLVRYPVGKLLPPPPTPESPDDRPHKRWSSTYYGGYPTPYFGSPGGGGGGGGLGGLFSVPAMPPRENPLLHSTELITVLEQTVNAVTAPNVAQYADEGGPAWINFDGQDLWIRQTPEGHAGIAAFLANLCEAKGIEYEGPPPPAEPPALREAMERMRKLLAQPVDLDFQEVTLADVLTYLNKAVPGLNIAISADLADQAADPKSPGLTLQARGISAEAALRLLAVDGFAYEVRPGWVRVTLGGSWQRPLRVAMYRVDDLLALAPTEVSRGYTPVLGPMELVTILKQTIRSDSDAGIAQWSDEGGPAAIWDLDGLLIITQTEVGHQGVEGDLAFLRAIMARVRQIPPRPRTPVRAFVGSQDLAIAAVEKLLDTRIDVDLKDASPAEVIRAVVQGQPRLCIVVRPGLQWPDDAKVTLKGEVACRTLLDKLNQPLADVYGKDLTYAVRPDCIIFRDNGVRELPVALYLAADVIRAFGANETINRLKRHIDSEKDNAVAPWSDQGGPADAQVLSGVLIISQTPHGQELISEFLQEQRQEARNPSSVPRR